MVPLPIPSLDSGQRISFCLPAALPSSRTKRVNRRVAPAGHQPVYARMHARGHFRG